MTNTVKRGDVYSYKGKKVTALGTYEKYAWMQRTDGSKVAVRVADLAPHVTREMVIERQRQQYAAAKAARIRDATAVATKYPQGAVSHLRSLFFRSERTARMYLRLAGFSWTGRKAGWVKPEQPAST